MSGKIILLSSIIIGSMAVYFGFLNDKQENMYEIIEKTEKDIKYPQINFLNENDSKKEEKINECVKVFL